MSGRCQWCQRQERRAASASASLLRKLQLSPEGPLSCRVNASRQERQSQHHQQQQQPVITLLIAAGEPRPCTAFASINYIILVCVFYIRYQSALQIIIRDVTDSESASESDGIRQFFRNPKSDGYLKSDRDGFKILVLVQLKCYFRK